MEIGRLRQRITLQKQVNVRNSYGSVVTEWQNMTTVWAEIKPISGREYFASQQVQSEVTTQITLRYLADIEPTMRVKFNERHFEIISVINPQERNITLQLMCKEVLNERDR